MCIRDSVKTLSPEAARIMGLFLAGKDAGAIVRELWPDVREGRASQERNRQVQAVIRSELATARMSA